MKTRTDFERGEAKRDNKRRPQDPTRGAGGVMVMVVAHTLNVPLLRLLIWRFFARAV